MEYLEMKQKIAIAVLLALCCVSNAQDSAGPPDHGAYYKAKDGWLKLELLTATGVSVRAFSGVTVSYRGAEAPIQLSDRRPVFYIRTTQDKEALMAVAARNTAIVLLDKKTDHRELQTVKSGLFGAKAELDKKRTPEVSLHSVNNLMCSVTPNRDLARAEYLLTYDAMGRGGYDFGIK